MDSPLDFYPQESVFRVQNSWKPPLSSSSWSSNTDSDILTATKKYCIGLTFTVGSSYSPSPAWKYLLGFSCLDWFRGSGTRCATISPQASRMLTASEIHRWLGVLLDCFHACMHWDARLSVSPSKRSMEFWITSQPDYEVLLRQYIQSYWPVQWL